MLMLIVQCGFNKLLPDSLAGFKEASSRRGGDGKGKEGKGRRGAGTEGKGRGGEVDSDAQLEQGRRLAKAGPVVKTKCARVREYSETAMV